MHACAHVCGYVCCITDASVRGKLDGVRSEGNSTEFVSAFRLWVLGIEFRLPGLVASVFAH